MIKLKKKRINESVNMKSIDVGHHHVSYRGVKAVRCPFDYLMYQMIISEIQPDLVLK